MKQVRYKQMVLNFGWLFAIAGAMTWIGTGHAVLHRHITAEEAFKECATISHIEVLETNTPFKDSGPIGLRLAKCKLVQFWSRSSAEDQVLLIAGISSSSFVAYAHSPLGDFSELKKGKEYVVLSNHDDIIPFVGNPQAIFEIDGEIVVRQSLSEEQRAKPYDPAAREWGATPIPIEVFFDRIEKLKGFTKRWPEGDEPAQ